MEAEAEVETQTWGGETWEGEQIQIAASQKVKFLPAKALKEVFNK